MKESATFSTGSPEKLTVDVTATAPEVGVGDGSEVAVGEMVLPLIDAELFFHPANLVQYPSEPLEPVKKLRRLGGSVIAMAQQR